VICGTPNTICAAGVAKLSHLIDCDLHRHNITSHLGCLCIVLLAESHDIHTLDTKAAAAAADTAAAAAVDTAVSKATSS
jgi:hypothetical protein